MYVKQFDEKGNVTNPITKASPFVNKQIKQRYQKQRKKAKLIVTKIGRTFFKYRSYMQNINGKQIEHLRLISSASIGLK